MVGFRLSRGCKRSLNKVMNIIEQLVGSNCNLESEKQVYDMRFAQLEKSVDRVTDEIKTLSREVSENSKNTTRTVSIVGAFITFISVCGTVIGLFGSLTQQPENIKYIPIQPTQQEQSKP